MKDIDFLPQRYRDQDAQRQAVAWRLIVIALFGGVVVAAAVAQLAYRSSVRMALDQVRPQFAEAQAKSQLLLARQTELNDATAAATLCALLESPWPRTQILATIFEPLPATITIEELHIAQQEKPTAPGASAETTAMPAAPPENSAAAAIPLEKQDLLTLHAQSQARQTTVHLTGTTSAVKELNEYLELLQHSKLIVRVELLSLEHDMTSPDAPRLRFTAQATIRPSLAESPSAGPLAMRSLAEIKP
jgi:hypothetical protein